MNRSGENLIEFAVKLPRSAFTLDVAFTASDALLALFGPSGAGKTTVLHLISGLERGGQGRIVVGGEVFYDSKARVFLPPHRRRVGLVYQDAQLFPHMSVAQNLRFGRRFAPKTIDPIPFDTVVETLGLQALLDRRTPSLSGGEKQRVALARALLGAPRLLLMDEPLSSLDDARKAEIIGLIERVRDVFRVPIVYVSHARAEVARLATKVVMLEAGRVAEVGSPQKVFASM